MKKIIVVVCLLYSSSAFSQDHRVFGGFRGGVNFSHANSSSFTDSYKTGFEAGLYLVVPVSKTFAIQGEAMYTWSRLSAIYERRFNLESIAYGKKKLNYWSFPVLLRVRVSDIFSLQAGPQFNFLTKKDKYKMENGQPAFKSNYVAATTGFELNLGDKIKFYGRYSWGLTSFESIGDNRDARLTRFQIGVFDVFGEDK